MKTLALLLVLLGLAPVASGQSLADVARKERERREKLKAEGSPATATLTDEDLSKSGGKLANDPKAVSSVSPQRARRDEPASTSSSDEMAQKEAYWRGRVAQARARLERARQEATRLERAIKFGQPARYEIGIRVMYSAQRLKAMADEAQAELTEAEQALEDLLEQARRAGALPGWLR